MSEPTQSQPQQQDSYRVYRPEFDTVAFDPLDPAKRYHEGVFIELDAKTGKGTLFHVTGDIISNNGMFYEERRDYASGLSDHLHSFKQIGWVRQVDFHSGRLAALLRDLPRPTKQQGLNFWVKPYTDLIWTKQDGEPYGSGEPRRPVFKCNEWTNLHAIPALRDAGILRDSVETST